MLLYSNLEGAIFPSVYRHNKPELINQSEQKYHAKREQILARQNRYRIENAEIVKSRRKSWYENNRERLTSSHPTAYCRQNKEHIRNYRRLY